jgi:uncharacterized OB-fold protein
MLTELNRKFWTSGRDGVLSLMRCQSCRRYLHPPTPICRYCRSRETAYESVSGRGTVASYSVNRHQWSPDTTTEPYVIALVQIVEQNDLRLITNIVNCVPEDVYIGMPVVVTFREFDDVVLPLFEPDGTRDQPARTQSATSAS